MPASNVDPEIQLIFDVQVPQWVENRRGSSMYLDDKASPELVRTRLQHSFQNAHVKALQHMRHLKKDFIVLAQHLDQAKG